MRLADLVVRAFAPGAQVRVDAYDGSSAGPADADVRVEVRSPDALRYVVQSPGELGFARAVVAGEIVVHGDVHAMLARLATPEVLGRVGWRERLDAVRALDRSVLRPLAPPPEEVRLRGRRHTPRRDAQAVSHHYDVSNRFYELVLGPSMAYTCAVYPRADATLEEAQEEKFDLVCRKLGLRPGQRLLDVGCGWGGMVTHAVRHYGVTALGVTLSRQQAEWGQKALAEAGLSDVAEIRHLDYRAVTETGFDAVSSIGLTEHIGVAGLAEYAASLFARLRPQGRLLNHCILRPRTDLPAIRRRGFVNRYVFPDGELPALGHLVPALTDAGFEVRHAEDLREHYALTLRDWGANLDASWEGAVAEVGPNRARVWALYMAGSRLAFERDQLQLHQLLCVRPDDAGDAGLPLRQHWRP